MRIVFLNYNYLPQYEDPYKWIARISPFIIVLEELAKNQEVHYVGQIGYEGRLKLNNVNYTFVNPRKNSLFPLRLHQIVQKIDPEIILIPGFHFPLQVLQLRFLVGKSPKIVQEYHADKPGRIFRKLLQKLAARFITSYHFTSIDSAREWIEAGIIHKKKCIEISSASVSFNQKNKFQCRKKLNISTTDLAFLWVGRLNENKDPLTVLDGFEKYSFENASAKMYMIYQGGEMLEQVKNRITTSPTLSKTVELVGEIIHDELATWYRAADVFISGSHREGGSLSLLEALSCGCIPVVTKIPAAMKVIDDGRYGFYYEAGNADDLLKTLLQLPSLPDEESGVYIKQYYEDTYSPAAIAKQFENFYSTPPFTEVTAPSFVSL
ncbi:MAG: hypothetical protein JWN76_1099 [Chitinophagaceae bacterium]|nr:hypothetical protein [Chitinophagaceae bacterium]